MKKFLLFAAAAAMMMSASAQVNVEQLWKHDVSQTLSTADCRQGFGMNGKIFINDKANQKVVVFGQGGLADEEYPGGTNCGITRDEAGNLVISTAGFPNAWTCDGETPIIKVVNPNDPTQVKEYFLPEEVGGFGRCDMIGFAKGNLLEEGVLYICGGASDQTLIALTITDGEVNLDDTFAPTIDGGVTASTSNVINFYVNKDGEDRLLYANRTHGQTKDENGIVIASTNIGVKVLAAAGDNFAVESTPVLPNKSASNGAQIFVWDGEEYAVYPMDITNNYRDGIAIVKLGDTEPTVICENTLTANPNAFQANWVNAEVNATDNSVTIYHYVPGAYVEAYKLTKAETPAAPDFYVVGGFNNWDTNNGVKITEDGATFDVQAQDLNNDEDTNQEFKLITPSVDGGWTWIGGINENPEVVNWFEITDGMLQDGTEISLYSGNDGYNFRLPAAGNYTVKLVQTATPAGSKDLFEGYKMVVTQNSVTPTAITDVNGKTVANVKYVNLAGMQSNVPFDGINIAVTTYTDGSKNVVKVVK